MSLRGISLRQRLPLLTVSLLAISVTAFAAVAYRMTSASLVRTARDRLTELTAEFAPPMGAQFEARHRALRQVAADTAIVRLLTHPNSKPLSTTRARLELMATQDSIAVLAMELRDSTGRAVLAVGRGASADTAAWRAPLDTAWMSPLERRGTGIVYELRASVRAPDGRTVGQVAQVRTAETTNLQSLNAISALIGKDGALLLGNADGSLWTDLHERVERPAPAAGMVEYVRAGLERLSVTAPIPGTPLVLGFEIGQAYVTDRLHALLETFLLVGALVVLLGAGVTWWLSRGITGPLVDLTERAEAISAGDLTHLPAHTNRADEVGRLSRAFAAMTTSVRDAHEHLEQQVAERTSELRAAQEELLRKERLATLGQLSSSVGHELRNPLGVMSNAVYFLKATLTAPHPKTTEYLGILQSQIALAGRIVGDLLDFARVRPPQRQAMALADVVSDQLERTAVPPSVRVEQSALDGPSVLADPVQIGQVVLNLMTNAVQAMEESGGTLHLSAEAVNGTVLLHVRDTGPGIAKDVMAKIFEPLFTTKARGIGLGLSVSRSLAQANGGRLTVHSAPGRGATFTLELPVAP